MDHLLMFGTNSGDFSGETSRHKLRRYWPTPTTNHSRFPRSRACGVKDAYCLLILGDSITTDHISPAGSIHKDSPAAEYLLERGVDPKDFSSYGSRSGNDEIMARGTFPNIRTRHYPSGEEVSVFDAALRYKNVSLDTIVLAGKGYGSGSSSDSAAKGLMLLVLSFRPPVSYLRS